MTTVYKPERKTNYTSVAYETIKNAIIQDELKPGDHLNAPYLAKVLGMSRTPVREALKMLEKDGLVESKTIGIYVKHMSLKELADFTDVRAALECQALKTSLPNIRDEEIGDFEAKLLALKSDMEAGRAVKYETVNALDDEIHFLITTKSNNSFLIDIINSISHITSRYHRLFINNDSSENLTKAIDDHLALVYALKSRNLSRIAKLLYNHIQIGAEELAELLRKQGDGSA